MYVYHVHDGAVEAREGTGSIGTGIMNGCKLPCGCWELNTGPLPDQSALNFGAICLAPVDYFLN